jgi:cysteine synthase
MDKTLEDYVGDTPLVRLKRLPGAVGEARGNRLLAKLEGNNPAGSVKDRPALSMIARAEQRGDIKPGDTLIEATSGNTGIALAMAAALRGYRMILVMPENQSVERRQTMQAFGAELVLTPREGSMELARDVAEAMRNEGRGIILDQFANPDNPLAHYEGTGPELWRQTAGTITHFVSSMGTTGTIMGVSHYLKEQQPERLHRWLPARRGFADSRYPQMAGGLPAQDLRSPASRSNRIGCAGRRRAHDAPAGSRRRYFRWHIVGRCAGRRPAAGRRTRERHHRQHRLRPG